MVRITIPILLSLIPPVFAIDPPPDPFGPATGQEAEPYPFGWSDGIQAKANLSLPAQVEAQEGRLTLFADFDHPSEKGIDLYLINRTRQAVTFSAQDGDMYFKLEMKSPSGKWQRAQIHQYSDCGNSYGSRILMPGMYLRLDGYQPAKGESATARYSCFSDENTIELTSNTGKALISREDVKAASLDSMSLRGVPYPIPGYFNPEFPNRDASTSSRVAALKMASLLGELPAIRVNAEAWAKEIEKKADAPVDEKAALPLVRQILKTTWGEPLNTVRLLKAVADAVKSVPSPDAPFGSLEKESALTWSVISAMAKQKTRIYGLPPETSKEEEAIFKNLLLLAADHALEAKGDEANSISELLAIGSFADEWLPDSVFEKFLPGESYGIVATAANTLARRGRWERLAELGSGLKAPNQLIVLSALARQQTYDENRSSSSQHQVRRSPASFKEEAFWKKVLQDQPVDAAYVLQPYANGSSNPFRRDLFEEWRAFWQKEIERSDQQPGDFDLGPEAYKYRLALGFMTAWQHPDDKPLLRSLLRYRGYESDRFAVRESAARALQAFGESLPPDLVFKVKPAK